MRLRAPTGMHRDAELRPEFLALLRSISQGPTLTKGLASLCCRHSVTPKWGMLRSRKMVFCLTQILRSESARSHENQSGVRRLSPSGEHFDRRVASGPAVAPADTAWTRWRTLLISADLALLSGGLCTPIQSKVPQ